MGRKRRIAITIETDRILVIQRRHRGTARCTECAEQSEMAPAQGAASLAGVSLQDIHGRARNGQLHFCETAAGQLWICLNSLPTSTTVAVPPGFPLPAGPYAGAGLVTFDGHGKVALTSTQSFNGVIVPPTNLTGAYTVNADCTGTAALDAGGTFSFVIVDDGKEILFNQTNPGTAVTGAGKRL